MCIENEPPKRNSLNNQRVCQIVIFYKFMSHHNVNSGRPVGPEGARGARGQRARGLRGLRDKWPPKFWWHSACLENITWFKFIVHMYEQYFTNISSILKLYHSFQGQSLGLVLFIYTVGEVTSILFHISLSPNPTS